MRKDEKMRIIEKIYSEFIREGGIDLERLKQFILKEELKDPEDLEYILAFLDFLGDIDSVYIENNKLKLKKDIDLHFLGIPFLSET